MSKANLDNKLSAIVAAGRDAFKLQFQDDHRADNVSSEHIFAAISDHGLAKSNEGNVEIIAETLWGTHLKQAASTTDGSKLSDEHGYWAEHPDYPLSGWQTEVANEDTRQSYWEWVASSIERDADEKSDGSSETTAPSTVFIEYSLHANEDHIRSFLRGRNHPAADQSLDQAIIAVVICPADSTELFGFSISPPKISKTSDRYSITLLASVSDREKLRASAIERYRKVWQDDTWEPETSSEAVYEILTGSNDLPPPLDIGFELIDWKLSKEAPFSETTNPTVEEIN